MLKNVRGRVKVPLCMSLKYMDSRGVAALIHNMVTRWKRVISNML